MVYEERNTWVGLIVSAIGMTIYVIVVLREAGAGPLTDVVWWPIMLWTIGASIVVSIVVSILWGIFAGMRDPDGVGQAFLVIAGLGVLVLCAFEADWFWIANTMFFGFSLSAFVGGVASVIAYRRGLL